MKCPGERLSRFPYKNYVHCSHDSNGFCDCLKSKCVVPDKIDVDVTFGVDLANKPVSFFQNIRLWIKVHWRF